MGLFDFFKKKDKKEDQQAEKQESKILLAMPLFKNGETYDIEKVIGHLKTFWQLDVSDEDKIDNEAAVFSIEGQMVAIARMPGPVPWEEIKSTASYNYLWPSAEDELKDHTGHAIVTVMSGDMPALDRYRILSKMLCSILMTSNCVGIYQGSQTLLLSREYYLDCVEDLQTGEIPVPIWIYIGIRSGDNGVSLYTYGMEGFGKHEIEIIDSKKDNTELYDFLLNITSYVIGQDVTLKDGETIGYSADHKVAIKLNKGVFLEGQTLKMQL